jgi:ATP-dependent exoDNAse (exonuclease V) beta subunit
MDHHERIRLLYVAATRARDHLVVSVHRKERKTPEVPTAAEAFHQAGWDPAQVEHLTFDGPATAPPSTTPAPTEAPELPSPDDWQRDHDAALAQASKPLATSATRLAQEAAAKREAEEAAKRAAADDAGLAKGPKDLDQPPWQKGRYGTAIGRAVHGVLQTVDLATGDGLDDAVAAQAAAEGVLGKEDVIKALCQSALDSDIVKRAAQRDHWREVYVGVPHGDDGGILEGYIDLLYRDDDGLVIVDYKTDAWRTDAELDAKVERYAVQLQAYAGAVGAAVGEPAGGALLLFLGSDEAAERSVGLAGTR